MQHEIALERLLSSINELDLSVEKVQTTFADREDIPGDVHQRLNSYRCIVNKQRELWAELQAIFESDNREAMAQLVIKINALSSLLLDDIRSAIATLDGFEMESTLTVN